MGSEEQSPASSAAVGSVDPAISELRQKHRLALENLTLISQPFKTMFFFYLAITEFSQRLIVYLLKKGGVLAFLFLLVAAVWILLLITDGPHEEQLREFVRYARFALWWIGLGVASSIGLGSGFHTFLLYLGPHIAFYTIKCLQCGRVDLKVAPYDTILIKKNPSWLGKDCSEFGPPLYPASPTSLARIPFSKILAQVQLEAVLWGFGTALGELPPYFISRAASLSGSKFEDPEELEETVSKDGFFTMILNPVKKWIMAQSGSLNFLTILLLASVPNPLFDLAGILCGQFNVPFWKFFLATAIGKSIVKVHLQTIFIITLCNNQLLDFIEERLIWIFGHIPGASSVLHAMVDKLEMSKDKFLSVQGASSANLSVKTKRWNFSISTIWNTIILVMIVHFFVQIVTSIAQTYLKKQQQLELSSKSSEHLRPSVSEPQAANIVT